MDVAALSLRWDVERIPSAYDDLIEPSAFEPSSLSVGRFVFLNALVMTENGVKEICSVVHLFESIESIVETPMLLLPFKKSRMRTHARDAWAQCPQRALRSR